MALFLFGFALYGQGIYLVELQRLNGWLPALISGASTLSFLLSNILATFTSEFVERLGAKRLVLLGIAALAASMTMLASATTVWQLYAAFILMSLGWIGMGTVVIATVVSLWFVRRRGLAISLAYTGASFGGVVATPLLVLLVERFGFAAAMLTATAIMVAVLVPVALAWIGPRSQTGAGKDKRAIATSIAVRNGRNIAREADAQPGVLDNLASVCACAGSSDWLHRAPDRAA